MPVSTKFNKGQLYVKVTSRRIQTVFLAALFALAMPGGPAFAQDYTVNLKETDIQELI